jgi:hypothetical protein
MVFERSGPATCIVRTVTSTNTVTYEQVALAISLDREGYPMNARSVLADLVAA